MPGFADENGKIFPLQFQRHLLDAIDKKPDPSTNGLPTPTLETEADGMTFTLKGVLLDKLPANFAMPAGSSRKRPASRASNGLCGCVEPLGNGKFHMALDRSWPFADLYRRAAKGHGHDPRRRPAVRQISRDIIRTAAPQKITFDPIPDVKAGTKSIRLSAKSSAGLPVKFFVRVGPAVVHGDELVFTPIPPRSKLPLTVTVGAWQWGRGGSSPVQTASVVEQTFNIVSQ